MGNKTSEEPHLTRYLLGEVTEQERTQIEEEYFKNDEAFEQVLLAEEELIDSYARRELTSGEQWLDEIFLTTPQGRQRLRFARALANASQPAAVKESTPHQNGFFATLQARLTLPRLALVASLLVAVILTSWLLIERSRLNRELRSLEANREVLNKKVSELEQATAAEQTRNRELAAQLEKTNAGQQSDNERKTSPSMLSFTLISGLLRGSGPMTLLVSRETPAIGFQLVIERGSYVRYRAVIQDAEGRTAWIGNASGPGHVTPSGLTLALPPVANSKLPPGDYVLLLSGKPKDGGYEDVADYSFRIVRK